MCNLETTEKFGTFIASDGSKKSIRPLTSNKIIMVVVPILWGLTASCLACAWYYPFLELTAWYLHHYSYNLFQVAQSMWMDEYYLFGGLVGIFVLVMPTLKLIALAGVWCFD